MNFKIKFMAEWYFSVERYKFGWDTESFGKGKCANFSKLF